jgi:hypothetical protein
MGCSQKFAAAVRSVLNKEFGVRQSSEQKVGLSPADALFREQTESDHRSLGPAPHDCAICPEKRTGFEATPIGGNGLGRLHRRTLPTEKAHWRSGFADPNPSWLGASRR